MNDFKNFGARNYYESFMFLPSKTKLGALKSYFNSIN